MKRTGVYSRRLWIALWLLLIGIVLMLFAGWQSGWAQAATQPDLVDETKSVCRVSVFGFGSESVVIELLNAPVEDIDYYYAMYFLNDLSGKSTSVNRTVNNWQRKGSTVYFYDDLYLDDDGMEYSIDRLICVAHHEIGWWETITATGKWFLLKWKVVIPFVGRAGCH